MRNVPLSSSGKSKRFSEFFFVNEACDLWQRLVLRPLDSGTAMDPPSREAYQRHQNEQGRDCNPGPLGLLDQRSQVNFTRKLSTTGGPDSTCTASLAELKRL